MPETLESTIDAGKARPSTIARIAVGVDGHPRGHDAVVLGNAIAQTTGADLMLVGIYPEPLVVLPEERNRQSLREQTAAMLAECHALAPGGRTRVECDFSIPRALKRVVERDDCDLLVLGSSRHAPEGRVRIGKRTRQLLSEIDCALAIAPQGLASGSVTLMRIGVGYDSGEESTAALSLARALASVAGASLHVCAVVDDRVPPVGWSALDHGDAERPSWEAAVTAAAETLRARALAASNDGTPTADVRVTRGRPADALVRLSREVDLLVIGSRRWGHAARVLLGSTGEALAHDARCSVLVAPRPLRSEPHTTDADSSTVPAHAEAATANPAPSPGEDDRPVIVGVDGRGHDDDALALARTLHAAFGGGMIAAHVIPAAPPGQSMVEAEREFRRHGRALLRHAAAKLHRPVATELVEPGSPARRLAQLAQQHRAATLVLGSSHRGAAGRIVPGGVATRLITRTPCAIAIAPIGYAALAEAPIRAVGVAYDGLAESDAALAGAAAAAGRLGVPLRLYHAMHEVPKDPDWEEFRGHMREFAHGILKAGLARLRARVQATTAVLEGDVATVVARTAQDDDVGLLFVGSRGYGPVREALARGVVGGLLRSSRVPLVIVPPAADGASFWVPNDRGQPLSVSARVSGRQADRGGEPRH